MDEQRAELEAELAKVVQAIEIQEGLRGVLTEEQIAATLAVLREKQASLTAALAGSGAIAQGSGSTALGERAVKARDARAVSTGDNSPITLIEKQEILQPPATESKVEKARYRYLQRLMLHCNALPLAALGGDEGVADEVGLDQVYIDLDTRSRVPLLEEERDKRAMMGREDRPLSIMEAATESPRLVLLGDPGSGKSSFTRQLTAWLAGAQMGNRDWPPGWDYLLPVYITLRDLAPRLASLTLENSSAEEQHRQLIRAVEDQWEANLEAVGAIGFLEEMGDLLVEGKVLLIFDGLDEIPEKLRLHIRQAIRAVLEEYRLVRRVIVTCRIRSYTGNAVLPGFATQTLAPFDGEKIRRFVQLWYQSQVQLGRLTAVEAAEKIDDLQRAATAGSLVELAANPMLLTTMAIIHQREVGLPEQRVLLYSQAVQILLNRWQKRKGMVVSDALGKVLDDGRLIRTILERLAYEAHLLQGSKEQGADLSRKDILNLLEEGQYLGDVGLAAEFLEYVDQRAGLLIGHGGDSFSEKPQLYGFPHRTFQEYLAGCYMITGRDMERKFWRHVKEGDYWYLAAQLGSEELLFNNPHSTPAFLDLAYELCPERGPKTAAEWRATVWSGVMAASLGRVEVGRDDKLGGGQSYLDRLESRLIKVLRESPLKAIERSEAGRILARLGDPRPEVTDVDQMQFCFLPAGPFWMGSQDDPAAEKREKPGGEIDLDYDYWLARYPVTHAQYARFVVDGGYGQGDYWPEAQAAGCWSEAGFQGRYDRQPRLAALSFGEPYDLSNHPIVGVSWYEALAFCRWLTGRWHKTGQLPAGWRIGLPSEAEWEKAARGGRMIPTTPLVEEAGAWRSAGVRDLDLVPNEAGRRIYPWGDEFDPQRANTKETAIGDTSAVGCFPGGRTPYGVEEMSGNVFEWTRSLLAAYPYKRDDGREQLTAGPDEIRVIRGGSFYGDNNWPRCAYRDGDNPLNRDYFFGFRVVASPKL